MAGKSASSSRPQVSRRRSRSRSRPSAARPVVLVVDDRRTDLRAAVVRIGRAASVRAVLPSEITAGLIAEADLALVDYDLSEWFDNKDVSNRVVLPSDGLALAAVIRSASHANKQRAPLVVALYSGHLEEIAGAVEPEYREHVFARLHDIEWAFAKGAPGFAGFKFGPAVSGLAAAARSLPNRWPASESGIANLIHELLAIPTKHRERLIEDIDSCHPPKHELARVTGGLSFLRWLLHRILPYPTFLWDTTYVAARLRVTPESLHHQLSRSASAVARMLSAARYSGILSDFIGPRWWRGALESVLWQRTNGKSFDRDALKSLFAPGAVEFVDFDPVVALDVNLRPTQTLIPLNAAVQVRPDDWPPYADAAWVDVATARTSLRIANLVLPADRQRVRA